MKKLLYIISFVVIFLWCLPQNLIGLFWILVKREKFLCVYKYAFVFIEEKQIGSVTLGNFCFVSPRQANVETITHEYGHVHWSSMLGPLFLLVIGIPSIIHAGLHDCRYYYHFYTEKWAEMWANKKERSDNAVWVGYLTRQLNRQDIIAFIKKYR